MKLLALDTATELCSAALWIDSELRWREALAPREHGALILPMVEELLGEAALTLAALDAIAFGRGPGAFTGLRLAAAVAQGLGFAAQRPLIPISDLRAVAAQALARPGAPAYALICQDARMDEVYWGCFERTGVALHPAGDVRPLGDERVDAPAAVHLPTAWQPAQPPAVPPQIWAAGSGFEAYPALRTRLGGALSAVLPELRPHAREIARLAAQDGLACAVDPEQGLPVYLRDRVAVPSP